MRYQMMKIFKKKLNLKYQRADTSCSNKNLAKNAATKLIMKVFQQL